MRLTDADLVGYELEFLPTAWLGRAADGVEAEFARLRRGIAQSYEQLTHAPLDTEAAKATLLHIPTEHTDCVLLTAYC